MPLSIIIPFHRNIQQLRQCLAALQPLPAGDEVIVVADGAVEDCGPITRGFGAVLVETSGPSGPAVARNVGASQAHNDVLVFVDADVAAPSANLARIASMFAADPALAAVFGAYDEEPAEPNFVSQYKNLMHSYIHQSSNTVAQTFWAGLGAVRRDAFWAVGGFDERFRVPSVEDIDLGYRLTAAGYPVRLDHGLRACHLKRWTLRSLLVSDVRDRGIPWTQLILRNGRAHNDLNLRSTYRVCVVLAYMFVVLLAVSPRWPVSLVAALATLALLLWLSGHFYCFFIARRGLWFASRVVPLHILHHLYNGVSFAVGSALFLANRWLGMRLPGSVPLRAWSQSARSTSPAGPGFPSDLPSVSHHTVTSAPRGRSLLSDREGNVAPLEGSAR